MGRQLRAEVPQTKYSLTPKWPYLKEFREEDRLHKKRQKDDYDKRHRTHPLPDLPDGTDVWVNTGRRSTEGVANPDPSAPRSYTVTTNTGTVRRNRSHLNVVPQPVRTDPSSDQPMSEPPERELIMTRSRTGTPIVPPARL